MRLSAKAFTLAEMLVASAITSVVVGGTMAAFVTAAREQQVKNGPELAEASGYAQQLLEEFRNHVAAATDDPFLTTRVGTSWRNDGISPLPAGGGSESILNLSARRCYQVTTACGGECTQVQAMICWRDLSGCPCP